MTPRKAEQALYEDLLSIYARAGAEVTYESDDGSVKAYWPKRFLQKVKRAKKQNELFAFVERLVQASEPSRGFFILKKAERLDLTVEALIVDEKKPHRDRVEFAALEAARYRLRDHDYPYAFSKPPQTPSPEAGVDDTSGPKAPELVPGASFDVRVTVGENGDLSLALI